jgi:hypothetical protein
MEVNMSYIKIRDRKLLLLFDFFMEIEEKGYHENAGCPFANTEFNDVKCDGCCGAFFGTRGYCPCFELKDPIGDLKRLLAKEGFLPDES